MDHVRIVESVSKVARHSEDDSFLGVCKTREATKATMAKIQDISIIDAHCI